MHKATKEKAAYLNVIGLDPNDVLLWKAKWQTAKLNAKHKGVEFLLSFQEYVSIAKESGLSKPDDIGQSIDSYHLGRVGDAGSYEVGNCRFITQRQNIQERTINGGTANISMKLSGRNKVDYQHVADHADRMSRTFRVKSPDGIIYEGKNLKEFCLRHGIKSYGRLSMVCNGKLAHSKGWTGEYLDVRAD